MRQQMKLTLRSLSLSLAIDATLHHLCSTSKSLISQQLRKIRLAPHAATAFSSIYLAAHVVGDL